MALAASSGRTSSPRTGPATGLVGGKRYRAREREIAATPRSFFFCCLLCADDSDFPAAVELGLLRPAGRHVERFRNRFGRQ